MKNTLHPRLIALITGALLALCTTSCSTIFWSTEQTVRPRLRGPIAMRPDLAAKTLRGEWHTTLHNDDGDTINHRWEGRNLVFEKSTSRMTLLVWDKDEKLVRGLRFFLGERRYWRKSQPFRWAFQMAPGERYAYYPFGTVATGIIPYTLALNGSEPPLWTMVLFPIGVATDIATGIAGEIRANKDLRRRRTLVKIVPLNEDPDWLPASGHADDN